MNFKDYVNVLKKLLKENPELANAEVVYSTDDEGNGFSRVHYNPSIGHFDGEEFRSKSDIEDEDEEETPNAVCIN